MEKKVLFGSLFVILAFGFMFFDAQYHIDFKSKPSMAVTHGKHGGEDIGHDMEKVMIKEHIESHATADNVEECFSHNTGDTYEETLGHCQKDICASDTHCFEEVEKLSLKHKVHNHE